MKRVKANDGSAKFVHTRSNSDPFITTHKTAIAIPRTWFHLKLKNRQSCGAVSDEARTRTRAWVQDQQLILFGGCLLIPPVYESWQITRTKAVERRQRFRDQERHRGEVAKINALRDQALAAAQREPAVMAQAAAGGGKGWEDARREGIRRCVGQVALFLGAMAASELAEDYYACECDGSECFCESESESESGSGFTDEEVAERPYKRQRVED